MIQKQEGQQPQTTAVEIDYTLKLLESYRASARIAPSRLSISL